jgi:hypothetical protein
MVLAGENVAMPSSSRNKRKAEATSIRFGARLSLAVPVRLNTDAGTAGPGTIRNASISGALIETSLELPLHTNLVVELSVPDGETTAIHALSACVVRLDPSGIGIEWRDMAGSDIVELLDRASVRAPG